MPKFIISTDSTVDLFKSYLEEKNVYCLPVKRVLNGRAIGEIYDSAEEYDNFYEEIKKGALPTTSQQNSYELQEFFEGILAKEKEGDLIHVPLSSGLSGTCDNAKAAAAEINKKLINRQVYVVDSLSASAGIAMLVKKLIKMRDDNVSTIEAIRRTESVRDNQQVWVIMNDLFHLRRGGRISGVKAALGTLLGIKPIILIAKNGRLEIENKMKGYRSAIKYILSKMDEFGSKVRLDFKNNPVYLVRTSKSDLYDMFKESVCEAYPDAAFEEYVVGPIIGTHLGGGGVIVVFEGGPRLDI